VKAVETAILSRKAPGQEARRRAEHQARKRALAYLRASPGVSVAQAAWELGVAARTLAGWRDRRQRGLLRAAYRGPWRGLATREEVLTLLALTALAGRRLGHREVALFVPSLPRREACLWLRRFRKDWGRAWQSGLMLLAWTQPGTVWAMDYTEVEARIEGQYRYLLLVRDLGSGKTLLAQPCHSESEKVAVAALTELFKKHGAPLVLKADNGSAFAAQGTRALLETYGVLALYSPPRTPRYNAACEAGIGGLKTRVRHLAACAGRPGEWTCEDIERARCWGNAHGRPFGRTRPTPDEAWARRVRPSPEACDALRAAFHEHLGALKASRTSEPGRSRLALERRTALSRALVELGYLEIKSRRVSLPITPFFPAEIR
jgi:transposase InsO family protein